MTEPEPVYHSNGGKPVNREELLIAEALALRADLASVIKQAERFLEAHGMKVESLIVTRKERRRLTRK